MASKEQEQQQEQEESGALELKITKSVQEFSWTFETVKAELNRLTEKYKGLVVNDDNVEDSERQKREIARMRVHIEKFRKTVKSELDKPYRNFELQLNELKKIVEEVERPLAQQLDKYEESRKENATAQIKKYIGTLADDNCLGEKYVAQIIIADQWLNRSKKWKEVESEVREKVVFYLEMQKNEREAETFRAEKVEMAKILCDSLSVGLVTPLTFAEIENRVDNFDIAALKEYIKQLVGERKEREQRAAQQALDAEKAKQALPTPQGQPASSPAQQEVIAVHQAQHPTLECHNRKNICFTLHEVDKDQYEAVKAFLREQGITFTAKLAEA